MASKYPLRSNDDIRGIQIARAMGTPELILWASLGSPTLQRIDTLELSIWGQLHIVMEIRSRDHYEKHDMAAQIFNGGLPKLHHWSTSLDLEWKE
ncbi:hypothetical protein BDZ45DRAFT_747973 [Acephala macrosclerotiorum]|nr:hypothetical protein BDZ45DRAFT_747973 [Acephala macrosclerotiorum]